MTARVVVVTGAGGQLGGAIAVALVARGASVLLVDRDADALERRANELGAEPSRVATHVADVTRADAPAGTFDRAVDAFGRVDAIVNNAGIEGPIHRLEDVSLEDFRRVFEINVFAVAAFSAEAMRRFRAAGRGRIVNIASGAGLRGTGLMVPYSASKHAVVGLSRSLAQEAGAAGIQVNTVCPGVVASPMMELIEARLGELAGTGPASFVDAIPTGRYCEPAEVGELVAWLALEAPDYVTGTAQVIDGGLRG